MIRAGAFRVIITTNFDRLLEAALEASGVVPTVISSPDDARGAIPIVHANCTIIKVHGDYLDTRIKNSPKELDHYDKPIDVLIDRIFDEFGLIVCGWSADYDSALRAAIRRTPSRRYPVFWTMRGKLSRFAKDLTRFRQAIKIEIDSADEFFMMLAKKHEAIRRYSGPHPLSKAAAIHTLLRYMSDRRFKIDLRNFATEQVRQTTNSLREGDLPSTQGPINMEKFSDRVRLYEQKTQILRCIFARASYWAEADDAQLWGDCFAGIASLGQNGSGLQSLLNVRMYPALLLKYATGLGAVLSGNYGTLAEICLRRSLGRHEDGDEFGLDLHCDEVIG